MADARRFAVHRVAWHDESWGEDGYLRRLPKTEVVARFDDFADAVADCRRREAEARAGANPFRYGGASLYYQSSLPAPVLYDWLLERGIEAPAPSPGTTHADYVAWWARASPRLTGEQRAAVWEALDRVRFFEVVEEPITQKAYVVVEVNWTWNDNPFLDADPEGGNVLKAFRDRAKAEAYCEELNRRRRAEGEFQGYRTFDAAGRGGGQADIADAVFFEVVEVGG